MLMEHFTGRIQFLQILIVILLAFGLLFVSKLTFYSFPSTISAANATLPSGCTVFTVSKGDKVFFGGNDDYINPDSYYWIDPGDSRNYGAIWIGQPDNVQQGINEHGLACH